MKALILFAAVLAAFLCMAAAPQEAAARCRGCRCGKAPVRSALRVLVPGPRINGGCQNGQCR